MIDSWQIAVDKILNTLALTINSALAKPWRLGQSWWAILEIFF
jgi:hypothetical protein